MTNEEIYDFIGELAIALYSKKIQISLGALRAIMLDKGKDYVNNRGMASAVSAAYRRWKTKDPIIYYAIAYTYTDKEGNLAWDDPKNEKKKIKAEDSVEEVQEEKPVTAEKEPSPVEEISKEETESKEEEPSQGELDLETPPANEEEKQEQEIPREEKTEEEKPVQKKKTETKSTGTKKTTAKKKTGAKKTGK